MENPQEKENETHKGFSIEAGPSEDAKLAGLYLSL